jgi:hypothetical protein
MRLFAILVPPAALTGLGVFLVDDFLGLNRHVHDVGGFGLESAFCGVLD